MAVRGSNSLFFSTGLDNTGLKTGSTQAVSIIQSMSSRIGKINPFLGLALAATAAFAKISSEAYKLAKDFEHAMKEVETISDATQKNFDGISKQVFELSKSSPDGPVELAKAYYQIVSAGHDGAAGLRLLEVASKAAVGGVTDTKTAADGLTTILNAWKIEAEKVSQVSDVLFTTVKLGKTTFEELSNSISVVAPLAAATGISLEEVTGAVASLTKQGVPTTVAMTQIRQAIIALTENLGDGWSETYTFQEALGVLVQKANGSQNELKKLVGRIEGVNAVLALTGDNAKLAASDLEAMGNSAGAAEAAFKTLAADVENQWKILGNRIRGLTRGLGESFLGLSGDLAEFLNDVIGETDRLTETYDRQRGELYKLKNELSQTNVSEEKRKEIVAQIIKDYPKYIEGIDLEKLSNEQLLGVLDDINESYRERYKLEKGQEELRNAEQAAGDTEFNIEKLQNDFDIAVGKIQAIADRKGIKLKINPDDSNSEILKDLSKQIRNESELFFRVRGSNRASGEGAETIETLSKIIRKQKDLNDDLVGQNKLVDETRLIYERLKNQFEDTFNAFDGGVSDEVQKTIDEVKAITLNDFRADPKIFEPFLKSSEEAVRKVAEARQKVLDYDPETSGDSPLDKFTQGLAIREEQYKAYAQAIEVGEKELAGKLKAQYELNETDFKAYLQNLYRETENSEFKAAIIDAAEQAGGFRDREQIGTIDPINKSGVETNISVDTTSYEAVQRRIAALQEQARKTQSAAEQAALGEKIAIEQQKLQAIENRINKSENAEEKFYRIIQSLSRKGLVAKKQQLKAELKETEKSLGKASDEYKKLADQIEKINEETGNDLVGLANEFSSAFSDIGELFSKFGDEDTAQLMEQLSGVADGIGQIASGDIIGGSLAILNSALTVEVVSDTAKFEDAIKKLEKAIEQLDYVISKSIGQDRVTNRLNAIKKQADLQEELNNAIEAEKVARKEVKFLGISIGKKGFGSGTDAEKLEEFNDQLEEAKRKIADIEDELDKIFTGTTETTIVDSIISGLKEGKRSVEDFAGDFEQLMQDAILNAFQLKYLEDEVAKFYDAFAVAGEDQNFTAAEINSLRAIYETMINGAQDDIDAINDILEGAGIGELGTDPKGLSGAIKTIQEDTANILAGTLNSIRIDVKQSLSIAQQSSEYLSQIAQNTAYNRYLESIDERAELMRIELSDIKDSLI